MDDSTSLGQSAWVHIERVDDGRGKTTTYVNGRKMRAQEKEIVEDLLKTRGEGWSKVPKRGTASTEKDVESISVVKALSCPYDPNWRPCGCTGCDFCVTMVARMLYVAQGGSATGGSVLLLAHGERSRWVASAREAFRLLSPARGAGVTT